MARSEPLAAPQSARHGLANLLGNLAVHPRAEVAYQVRVVEAVLFAAAKPLSEEELASCLPEGADVPALLEELERLYAPRGVNLISIAGKWTFRTADDLSFLLRREAVEQKRLSRAAIETLAIIAYHQPVTRADIEEVRGVAISKGTLDQLIEIGWVRLRGRRRTAGRPVTYGTTQAFLEHFGINQITDLPGLSELKDAGLLDANLPPDFIVPAPKADDALGPDEDPLGDDPPPLPLEMDLPEAQDVPDE